MADYSPNEIVDIILVLGECHSNYNAASRLYAQRFPERRHPTDMTIRSLAMDILFVNVNIMNMTKMMREL